MGNLYPKILIVEPHSENYKMNTKSNKSIQFRFLVKDKLYKSLLLMIMHELMCLACFYFSQFLFLKKAIFRTELMQKASFIDF